MKIVVFHSGPLSEVVAATSVNIGIRKQPVKTEIFWVVQEENKYIFRYNENVKRVFSFEEFSLDTEEYDLFINLWPLGIPFQTNAKALTGFGFHKEFDKYEKCLMGIQSVPEMSNFQLYFYLSGMTWRGEGYNVGYYPRTKKKKNRIGVSLVNANLRNYVLDNLELDNKKIWYIPYKKNIFKRMDEINRCEKIITDDLLTFHLSMGLRKSVYYLETYPHMMRIEMFKNGRSYVVPYSYL